jgi:hypothetical protein
MGGEQLVGWVDLRTGRRAAGAFYVNEVTEAHGLLAEAGLAYAIAPDGAVALAVQEAAGRQVVAEMLPRDRALSGPRQLHASETAEIVLDSIAIDLTTVSWRTRSDTEQSLPR